MASRQWDPDDDSGTFSDALSLESRSRDHLAAMDRINALMENSQIDDPWDIQHASTMSPMSGHRFIEASPPRNPSPVLLFPTPEDCLRYTQREFLLRNCFFGRPRTYSSHYNWLRDRSARAESGRIARTRASRRPRRYRTPRATAFTRTEGDDFALSQIRDRQIELRAELRLLRKERELINEAYRDSLEGELVASESDHCPDLAARWEEPDWQMAAEDGTEMEEDF
ncbi:unnamed protein product [Penicillium bialowiezense]